MRWVIAEEAEEIGRQVYRSKVRPSLEGVEEPIGYFLAVDHDSRDWELDEELHKASAVSARESPMQTSTPSKLDFRRHSSR